MGHDGMENICKWIRSFGMNPVTGDMPYGEEGVVKIDQWPQAVMKVRRVA